MFLHLKSFQTHGAKTDRTAKRNRQMYNYSQRFFLTLLSIIGRTNWQKICNGIEDLNNTINKIDVGDIVEHYPPTEEYTFFKVQAEYLLK